MQQQKLELTLRTENLRGARKLCVYADDPKHPIATFFGDPSKAVVMGILLNGHKLTYKKGRGLTVKANAETLQTIRTLAQKHFKWEILVNSGLIPRITEEEVRRFLALHSILYGNSRSGFYSAVKKEEKT